MKLNSVIVPGFDTVAIVPGLFPTELVHSVWICVCVYMRIPKHFWRKWGSGTWDIPSVVRLYALFSSKLFRIRVMCESHGTCVTLIRGNICLRVRGNCLCSCGYFAHVQASCHSRRHCSWWNVLALVTKENAHTSCRQYIHVNWIKKNSLTLCSPEHEHAHVCT